MICALAQLGSAGNGRMSLMAELLFASGELSAALRGEVDQIKEAIEHADPTRIRKADVEELVNEFSARGRVQPLELLENSITVAQSETKVDVSRRFEYAWDGEGPLLVDGVELSLHVPFSGERLLLRMRPSRSTLNPPRASVIGDELVLSASGPPQDGDRIKAQLQRELEALKQHAGWSRADVISHNNALPATARSFIEDRRQRLGQIPDLTGAFSFPLRASSPGPPTVIAHFKPEAPPRRSVEASKNPTAPEVLHLFLCHASQDKVPIRELQDQLKSFPVDVWLDEVKILPGQEWEREIRGALRSAHVVLVCLSRKAVTKSGFVQKEIKLVLDIADEQPEGTIFVIPVRLEECDVPDRLKKWQWVDIFTSIGVTRVIAALKRRAQDLNIVWPE
jgi:hypothetical protein